MNNFHCLPHRKYLTCRTLSKEVAAVMKEVIQVPKFVKVRSLRNGFFFQPDMSRLANTRIYFVLLRGLVSVTRKVLQLIVALRNKFETFLPEKRNTVLLRCSKFKRGLKLAYLSYISVNIKTRNFQWKAVIRQRYVRHRSWQLSRESCNCEDENGITWEYYVSNWTCFWKIKGWVSGSKRTLSGIFGRITSWHWPLYPGRWD